MSEDFLRMGNKLKRLFPFTHYNKPAQTSVNNYRLEDEVPEQLSSLRQVRILILDLFVDIRYLLDHFVCLTESNINFITIRRVVSLFALSFQHLCLKFLRAKTPLDVPCSLSTKCGIERCVRNY